MILSFFIGNLFFYLVGNAHCFGLLLFSFQIYPSTILSSKFMDKLHIQSLLLALQTLKGFWMVVVYPSLNFMNE